MDPLLALHIHSTLCVFRLQWSTPPGLRTSAPNRKCMQITSGGDHRGLIINILKDPHL